MGGEMTTTTTWTPSYLRRAPRWYDGVGRLMDVGSMLDLRLSAPRGGIDADALAEDLLVARQDLRRALETLALPT